MRRRVRDAVSLTEPYLDPHLIAFCHTLGFLTQIQCIAVLEKAREVWLRSQQISAWGGPDGLH